MTSPEPRPRGPGSFRPETAVEAALEALRGEYMQIPPAFSAKKVAGERAYARARRDEDVIAGAGAGTGHAGGRARVRTGSIVRASLSRCSAGFYVRSFAHALGRDRWAPALASKRCGGPAAANLRIDQAIDLERRAAGERGRDGALDSARAASAGSAVGPSRRGRAKTGVSTGRCSGAATCCRAKTRRSVTRRHMGAIDRRRRPTRCPRDG